MKKAEKVKAEMNTTKELWLFERRTKK